jgi:serpin B
MKTVKNHKKGVKIMKKSRLCSITLSLVLILAMLLNFSGCGVKVNAQDLMQGITPNKVTPLENLDAINPKMTDFAVRLFKASQQEDKNTLISPLSIISALAMTANGAQNETLEEMESVFGLNLQELNPYLHTYIKNLPQGEKYKLNLANSIWFTEDERFTVNKDFLQTNADYYNPEIYKAPFNNQTLKDINNWVNYKTDEMIPEILKEIPESAIMYLVNALAFDAKWDEEYEDDQIEVDTFTNADGTTQEVDFMYSTENQYLEDENSKGFIKYYKDKKYAFAAILPDEDLSLSEYIETLNGEKLYSLLNSPEETEVEVSIPQFEAEYSTEMSKVLSNMGMSRAFSRDFAQFQGLGTSTKGNIYISKVLHKTFISVGKDGTKAAAATVVEMEFFTSFISETKTVYLDRPFVYMLIDTENNIPFFIGTMNEIKK